jgi:hypothetical protein
MASHGLKSQGVEMAAVMCGDVVPGVKPVGSKMRRLG